MADELVWRLNPAARHGVAPLAGKPVGQQLLMSLEIADQLVDHLCGMDIWGFHPLQTPDDVMHFAPEESSHCRLIAFVLPLRIVGILLGGSNK
jgi:hypothetical protein